MLDPVADRPFHWGLLTGIRADGLSCRTLSKILGEIARLPNSRGRRNMRLTLKVPRDPLSALLCSLGSHIQWP